MKKLLCSLLMASFALAIYAQTSNQRYMRINKTDNTTIEILVNEIDSIDFITKSKPLDFNGHEYVDLGLPSGTLWATVNVGASSITDYGDYFAWGETQTKDVFGPETYKWYDNTNGSYNLNGYTKYLGTDSILVLEDDAAHVNWGGDWRMPTAEEWQELLDYCTWEEVTVDNVMGYIISNQLKDSYIFLPGAGGRYSNYVYNEGTCYYYSSSPSQIGLLSGAYRFQSENGCQVSTVNRSDGLPIRPVCSFVQE